MILDFFSSKLSDSNLQKVKEVSDYLGINPNWLLAVMYFETARTFSPSITNNIGSVGLIQFTRDRAGVEYKTINGKRYYLSDLKKMTFNEQMDVVQEYYKPYKGKINSFVDTYLVTFFPSAINKPNDYVLSTSSLSASLIASQNPVFDSNKNGQITKQEIIDYFDELYSSLGVSFNDIVKIAKKNKKLIIYGSISVFMGVTLILIGKKYGTN